MIAKDVVAILDLGSNTFHLLIVEKSDHLFKEIFRKRIFVGLSEGGIQKISDAAYKKGMEALEEFRHYLDEYNVSDYRAIGTSSLRSSANGQSFVAETKKKFGLVIEVIDGQKEAELIFKGVSLLLPMTKGSFLIMDIGGGSTEFIHVLNGTRQLKYSSDIGVGELFNKFRHSDPILSDELESIYTYISEKLESLSDQLDGCDIDYLVGASGSFEVLETMLGYEICKNKTREIDTNDFDEVCNEILRSTYEERLANDAIPATRAKLIVVGMALMNFVIQKFKPKSIIISPYALKEGLLSEVIEI